MRPRMISGKRDEFVAGSRRRRHAAKIATVELTERGWHRICAVYPLIFRAAPALFSLVLLVPSYAAAAENEDMAVGSPPVALPAPDLSEAATKRPLDQRVKDLEIGWAAQENATQQIIRDTLSKTGPKINNYLALSGVVEGLASRTGQFDGPAKENLALSTAELDFDIKLSDWLTGALVLHFDNGTGAIFPTGNNPVVPTTPGVGVDRFTLDRTHISIGDLMQFPIAARFGVETLHFGTSTGVARLDTLSIGTPLTTEVFENRQTAGGLEFAWPTPPRQPPPAPVVIPRVSPLVVAPAVSQLARWLGYTPLPERPFRPQPVTFPFDPPPFYGSVMTYKGSDSIIPNRTKIDDYNASLGFRTRGNCGVPYDQLTDSLICPWTFDFHVDYDTSVFESRFLHASYLPFLSQIGRIPGVAASVKASFGPFAFVGEVNAALQQARFLDGLGTARSMTPMAWQASIAYQFDWNPWITEIGAQGDFISLGYSGSKDMAGVTGLVNGLPTRIGFVPQNRVFLTAGEWVMDGLKVAVEYSANWDYPVCSGGTGKVAHGGFGLVQLNF